MKHDCVLGSLDVVRDRPGVYPDNNNDNKNPLGPSRLMNDMSVVVYIVVVKKKKKTKSTIRHALCIMVNKKNNLMNYFTF